MTINELMAAIKNIKKGTFVNIEYSVIPSLNAMAKKNGVSVVKKTKKVARIGVAYGNILKVIENNAADNHENKIVRENPYVWDVKNIIARNIKNDSLYLQIANISKNSHSESEWFVDGEKVSVEEVKQYIVPSYFNSKSEMPVVQKIKLENLVRVGN